MSATSTEVSAVHDELASAVMMARSIPATTSGSPSMATGPAVSRSIMTSPSAVAPMGTMAGVSVLMFRTLAREIAETERKRLRF